MHLRDAKHLTSTQLEQQSIGMLPCRVGIVLDAEPYQSRIRAFQRLRVNRADVARLECPALAQNRTQAIGIEL